ncbi:hypothetical protein D5086_017764 [Populus alba]|uniref:Uncharacterized protein n=1 Tax=Populus alba TaxID=43335 RepID=A0ACC4BN00_POPAL
MVAAFKLLHFLLALFVSSKLLALAQQKNQFIYHGFTGANLVLTGIAKIHPNGSQLVADEAAQPLGTGFGEAAAPELQRHGAVAGKPWAPVRQVALQALGCKHKALRLGYVQGCKPRRAGMHSCAQALQNRAQRM